MKKYFIVLSTLLLAAGCAKQSNTIINYPPPQNQSATSALAQNPDWQTYRELWYNFEFKYPGDFGFTQANYGYLPISSGGLAQLEPKSPGYLNSKLYHNSL